MSDMSSQIKQMRSQIEEDEMVASMMAGLRGSNVNSDNFAADNVSMRLVRVEPDAESGLPENYDPDLIAKFWGQRPVAVTTRILQLLSKSLGAGGRAAGLLLPERGVFECMSR